MTASSRTKRHYRIYLLNKNGGILIGQNAFAETDEEAVKLGRMAVPPTLQGELWQSSRPLARLVDGSAAWGLRGNQEWRLARSCGPRFWRFDHTTCRDACYGASALWVARS